MSPIVPPVAEVVARYRGRVVDIQHIRWSEPPAVTPAAWLGAGALLLLLGFALALRAVAQAEAAGLCELPPCPGVGVGAGLGACLVALGLIPLVLGLVRWRDRPRARYTIGEAPGVDFTVAAPGLPEAGVPLVIALEQGFVLGLPPGVRGTVDGPSPLDLAEAAAQGRRSISLPAGARAVLELGDLSFEIVEVPPPDAPHSPLEFDRLTWLSHIGAALLVGGWMFWLDRSPTTPLELDREAQIELVARYITRVPERSEATPPPPPAPPVAAPSAPAARREPVAAREPEPEPAAGPAMLVDEGTGLVAPRTAMVARPTAKIGSRFDREYDYERVAGGLGDPGFVNAVEDFTVNMRNGQKVYKPTADDDVWWAKATGGPPSMSRHFGGLELAETERGGGVHPDKPEAKKKPVPQVTLTAARGLQVTAEEKERNRVMPQLRIKMPTITPDSGIDSLQLQQYARKMSGPWRACYEKALETDPELAGIVQLQVNFDAEGNATLSRVVWTTLTIGTIADCLDQAARNWKMVPTMPRPTKAFFKLLFESHKH